MNHPIKTEQVCSRLGMALMFVVGCSQLALAQTPPFPDGGGSGNTNWVPGLWQSADFMPGLKMSAEVSQGTNLHIRLVEGDPAGRYDIFFAKDLYASTWSNVVQGVIGQSNFTLVLPNEGTGFFRCSRVDTPVVSARNLRTYFPERFVGTNLVSSIIEGLGPAAATAVVVNNTDFQSATWVPFTSTPIVNLGASEGEVEVWFGLKGGDGIAFWSVSHIVVDKVPPSISIEDPKHPLTTRPIIQIRGFSSEPLSAVYFDVAGMVTNESGFLISESWGSTTNSFQCFDVELTNGLNGITVRAIDLAGNETVTNIFITFDPSLDSTPPEIILNWPMNGVSIGATAITVRGLVDDDTALVTAHTVGTDGNTNLYEAIVERNGRFWLEGMALSDGETRIDIAAIDAAGNVGETNILIRKSELLITVNHLSDEAVVGSVATVTGTISAPFYTVTVNGVEADVDGLGNWQAMRVPIYGEGTAVFEVIAQLNQSPGVRSGPSIRKLELGSAPVFYSYSQEQPPVVFVSRYEDDYEYRDSLWGIIYHLHKTYNESWNANGQRKFSGELRSKGQDGDDGFQWWDERFCWSDIDPVGVTQYERGLTGEDYYDPEYYETGSVSGGGNRMRLPKSVPTVSPATGIPFLRHFHSEAQGARYTRSSKTSLRIRTGGKAGTSRKNLFRFSATGTQYAPVEHAMPDESSDVWYDAQQSEIDPEKIKLLGKVLGKDGNLFVVLPDNATLDLFASASAAHYDLNVGATKHKLRIAANEVPLQPDRVVSNARFCVGQKIACRSFMTPDIQSYVGELNAEWALPGTYVNYIESWPAGAKRYLRVFSSLQQQNTDAWWISGGEKHLRCDWKIRFSNGQSVKLYTMGRFNMHRPTISSFTGSPQYYAWLNTNTLHFGRPWLQLGEDDGNATGSMMFSCDVRSAFSGELNWTQLIKSYRERDDLPVGTYTWGTDGRFDLDGSSWGSPAEFYLSDHVEVAPSSSSLLCFGDGPGWPVGFNLCRIADDFKAFVRFRPYGLESIWVTLGRVDWSWEAEAARGIDWTITDQSVSAPQLNDDDAFPFWTDYVTSFAF